MALSTHSTFRRASPSRFSSSVNTSVSNRLIVLVLAACLSVPCHPTMNTHSRVLGKPFSVVGVLVASEDGYTPIV